VDRRSYQEDRKGIVSDLRDALGEGIKSKNFSKSSTFIFIMYQRIWKKGGEKKFKGKHRGNDWGQRRKGPDKGGRKARARHTVKSALGAAPEFSKFSQKRSQGAEENVRLALSSYEGRGMKRGDK